MLPVEVEFHVLHGEGVFLLVELIQGLPALFPLFFGPGQVFPLGEERLFFRLHLGLEFLVPERRRWISCSAAFLLFLRRFDPFQVFLNFLAALAELQVCFLGDPAGPLQILNQALPLLLEGTQADFGFRDFAEQGFDFGLEKLQLLAPEAQRLFFLRLGELGSLKLGFALPGLIPDDHQIIGQLAFLELEGLDLLPPAGFLHLVLVDLLRFLTIRRSSWWRVRVRSSMRRFHDF